MYVKLFFKVHTKGTPAIMKAPVWFLFFWQCRSEYLCHNGTPVCRSSSVVVAWSHHLNTADYVNLTTIATVEEVCGLMYLLFSICWRKLKRPTKQNFPGFPLCSMASLKVLSYQWCWNSYFGHHSSGRSEGLTVIFWHLQSWSVLCKIKQRNSSPKHIFQLTTKKRQEIQTSSLGFLITLLFIVVLLFWPMYSETIYEQI